MNESLNENLQSLKLLHRAIKVPPLEAAADTRCKELNLTSTRAGNRESLSSLPSLPLALFPQVYTSLP